VRIVGTTKSAPRSLNTEKVTDRVIVLIVCVDNFSLSIDPYFPLFKALLMLDIDKL
jgi:hypothetical protein